MIHSTTKHGLDLIDKSPLDYWHHYINPERPEYVQSDHSKFDKALRLAIFDNKEFKDKYVPYSRKKYPTNIEKAEYENLEKLTKQQGKILITKSEVETIEKIRESISRHEIIGKWKFKTGEPVFIEDKNIRLNITPHAFKDDIIINLTSVESKTGTSEQQFQEEAAMFNWHKKEAIMADATGFNTVFIVCEQKEPHNVGLYMLDERSVNLGREIYKDNLNRLSECLDKGEWPGVTPKIITTSLPEWEFKR